MNFIKIAIKIRETNQESQVSFFRYAQNFLMCSFMFVILNVGFYILFKMTPLRFELRTSALSAQRSNQAELRGLSLSNKSLFIKLIIYYSNLIKLFIGINLER